MIYFNLAFCKLCKYIYILINVKIYRNDFNWLRSSTFVVDSEHILQSLLSFSLLTLRRSTPDWVHNINVSSQLTKICQQQKKLQKVLLYMKLNTGKRLTLFWCLVLCCLKLNFKVLSFASDYVTTLNLFFVAGLTVWTYILSCLHLLENQYSFLPSVSFHTPWKNQQIFSGVIKREHSETIDTKANQTENCPYDFCLKN